MFLPELFTSSVQGHFVGPLALAFIFAVLASLLVAMTATPALCALLLRRHDARAEARMAGAPEDPGSAPRSIGVADHFAAVAAVLIGLVIAAGVALPFLGGTFMPDFREGHFVMQVSSSTPGTSLQRCWRWASASAPKCWRCPMSQSVEQQVGRAELGEDTWGPHRSEFHVELKADAEVDQGDAEEQLRSILARYPGLQSEVVTFLGDRISESLSGETAQVAVKVFGDDLDALDSTGNRIVAVLGKIPASSICNSSARAARRRSASNFSPKRWRPAGSRPGRAGYGRNGLCRRPVGQTFQGTRTVDVVLLCPMSCGTSRPSWRADDRKSHRSGAAVAGRPDLPHPGSLQHRA